VNVHYPTDRPAGREECAPSERGDLIVVQMLLDAGAQVRNVEGIRLTGYAQGKKRLQIIAVLEQVMQGNSTAH
jgi:hypothetical protein